MGSKKKKGAQAALTVPLPQAMSKSTSFTITTDYGDQVHIAQPPYSRGKMNRGYAGWIAAVRKANRMLQHDTKDASAFLLRVLDRITDVYNNRESSSHTYASNSVVMDMKTRLELINNQFKVDPSPKGSWAGKLPDQAEIYALAFSAWGFELDKEMSRFFELWGVGDWACVPGSNAVGEKAAGTVCEDETASRDVGDSGDSAGLAARVSQLEADRETDAVSHQKAREEDKAQINQLIEVVAYLSDHLNLMHGIKPIDGDIGDIGGIRGARQDPTVAPADLLKYMAKSARCSKDPVGPKAGAKRKRSVDDDSEGKLEAEGKRKRGADDDSENVLDNLYR